MRHVQYCPNDATTRGQMAVFRHPRSSCRISLAPQAFRTLTTFPRLTRSSVHTEDEGTGDYGGCSATPALIVRKLK